MLFCKHKHSSRMQIHHLKNNCNIFSVLQMNIYCKKTAAYKTSNITAKFCMTHYGMNNFGLREDSFISRSTQLTTALALTTRK